MYKQELVSNDTISRPSENLTAYSQPYECSIPARPIRKQYGTNTELWPDVYLVYLRM